MWGGVETSALQEALILAATPASLTLTGIALLTLLLRKLWLNIALCLGWITWALHLITSDAFYKPLLTAQQIGCIGTSQTYLVFGSLICTAVLARSLFFYKR